MMGIERDLSELFIIGQKYTNQVILMSQIVYDSKTINDRTTDLLHITRS
jgi:hypothetical protein